jgi:hypothetical protein
MDGPLNPSAQRRRRGKSAPAPHRVILNRLVARGEDAERRAATAPPHPVQPAPPPNNTAAPARPTHKTSQVVQELNAAVFAARDRIDNAGRMLASDAAALVRAYEQHAAAAYTGELAALHTPSVDALNAVFRVVEADRDDGARLLALNRGVSDFLGRVHTFENRAAAIVLGLHYAAASLGRAVPLLSLENMEGVTPPLPALEIEFAPPPAAPPPVYKSQFDKTQRDALRKRLVPAARWGAAQTDEDCALLAELIRRAIDTVEVKTVIVTRQVELLQRTAARVLQLVKSSIDNLPYHAYTHHITAL